MTERDIMIDPEDYVKENYSELKNQYGDSVVVVMMGKVILEGDDMDCLIQKAQLRQSPYPLKSRIIVGSLDGIISGDYQEVEAPIKDYEETLRECCNWDLI
jgi:hypothetical protein